MQYGPIICISVVLIILFVLWYFWGGNNVEFVGLAPLDPTTCSAYTGSVYEWGKPNTEGEVPEPGVTAAQTPVDPPAQAPAEVPVEYVPPLTDVCEADDMEVSAEVSVAEVTDDEEEEEEPVDFTPIVAPNFRATQLSLNQDLPMILNPQPVVPPRNFSGRYQNRYRGGKMVSRGERMCNETIQRIYGVPFANVRPAWLRNSETGERLELDCYNEDLQLAVEYNGIQHYVWPNFTGQSKQDFLKQVRRDRLKVELCDRYRVYLIVVPYIVDHDKIPEYIISFLPETIQQRISEEDLVSGIFDRSV